MVDTKRIGRYYKYRVTGKSYRLEKISDLKQKVGLTSLGASNLYWIPFAQFHQDYVLEEEATPSQTQEDDQASVSQNPLNELLDQLFAGQTDGLLNREDFVNKLYIDSQSRPLLKTFFEVIFNLDVNEPRIGTLGVLYQFIHFL